MKSIKNNRKGRNKKLLFANGMTVYKTKHRESMDMLRRKLYSLVYT